VKGLGVRRSEAEIANEEEENGEAESDGARK
jgi:hypothetical protein